MEKIGRQCAPDTTWQRASLIVEPRSTYLLQAPARSEWEHNTRASSGCANNVPQFDGLLMKTIQETLCLPHNIIPPNA